MTEKTRRSPGQPTKYKAKYCQMLIDHMAKGFSFESFAAEIGTHRDTLYEWTKKHERFSDAHKSGQDQCRKWWERAGHAGMMGKVKNFNASVWIFSMKNRHGWRDMITDLPPETMNTELKEALGILDAERKGSGGGQ